MKVPLTVIAFIFCSLSLIGQKINWEEYTVNHVSMSKICKLMNRDTLSVKLSALRNGCGSLAIFDIRKNGILKIDSAAILCFKDKPVFFKTDIELIQLMSKLMFSYIDDESIIMEIDDAEYVYSFVPFGICGTN